jgi:hypothetical protein
MACLSAIFFVLGCMAGLLFVSFVFALAASAAAATFLVDFRPLRDL